MRYQANFIVRESIGVKEIKMARDKKDSSQISDQERESQYSFIQETIRPKKHNKVRKLISSLGMAIVFGFVACLTFCISYPFLSKYFQVEKNPIVLGGKQEATLTQATPSQATVLPTKNPEIVKTPEITKPPEVTKEPEKNADIEDYLSMYSDIGTKIANIRKSMVTVKQFKAGTSVTQQSYENNNNYAGLVIAKTSDQIIILTCSNQLKSENKIMIRFNEQVMVDGKIVGSYDELGVTIISVDVTVISKEIYQQCGVAYMDAGYIVQTGQPVIGLGYLDGSTDMQEIGFISSGTNQIYITDNQLRGFYTTMNVGDSGNGFIFNMTGEVIGLITDGNKRVLTLGANNCLSMSDMSPIIQKVVNREKFVYFGIRARGVQNVIESDSETNNGVFVTDVIAESPAFEAGILSGDIIRVVEDQEVNSMSEFNGIISQYSEKDKIKVKLLRNIGAKAKEQTVEIKLIAK